MAKVCHHHHSNRRADLSRRELVRALLEARVNPLLSASSADCRTLLVGFPTSTSSIGHRCGDSFLEDQMPTVASRTELESLLEDDVPYGDLTTEALGIGASPGIM